MEHGGRDPVAQHLLSLPARSGLGAFFDGMGVPWQGYTYMRAHRRLWRYAVLPVILSTIITMVVFAAMVYGGTQAYDWADARLAQGWIGTGLRILIGVGVGVLVIAASIGVALLLNVLFCSLFYTALANAVERQLGTPAEELREVSLWVDLRDNLAVLMELVFVNGMLLVLNLVPVVGSTLSGAGSWYFNAFLLGAEFQEYPFAVRGWDRRQRRAFARSHRMHTLGLGTVVFVFNLVPILGGAVLTTAVTGSVFSRRRLLKEVS